MPSKEPSTTCPFLQHCTESQICRSFYISLSLIPPDPRLLLTSFPNLSINLAPCWTNPSSDCENRNVILSTFEKTNVRYQLISALFCDPGVAAPDTKVGYNT